MGPRHDWRGDYDGGKRFHHAGPLQWGHAMIGVETRLDDVMTEGPWELQWGHAMIGVETYAYALHEYKLHGFNGATP